MPYGTIKADKITYDVTGTDTEANVSDLVAKASLASPTFTGTPAAPTAAADTNTTQIATTAYVQTELGGSQSIDGQYIQQEETLTVSTNASTVDCSTGNYFTVQATGNITFTFGTPPADTKSYSMIIEVDHDSGTLTWPAAVKWPADTAPTLTTGKTHQFYFHTNDSGNRWRGGSLVDYVD